MLTRRNLLTGLSAGVGALALLSCTNGNQVAQIVATDATIIANGLSSAMSQLSTLNIPGLTPDKLQTIGLGVAGLKTVATALSGATTIASAQPLVQQIATDLNAIVDALATLPLPPQIALPLQAAAILLPIIETTVQLAITQINTPKAAGTSNTAATHTMTPDEARAVLIGVSH